MSPDQDDDAYLQDPNYRIQPSMSSSANNLTEGQGPPSQGPEPRRFAPMPQRVPGQGANGGRSPYQSNGLYEQE